jgi:hypothetical protein
MSPITAAGQNPQRQPADGVSSEQPSQTSPSAPTTDKETINEPRPAAVAFVTTEHFTLQGARSSTISESIGRAAMFLASLSGGLVALGLLATATRVGTAFYAFGLILLPTCAVLGLVTFQRTLQSGIEDHGYARRIAHLRAYYFDVAPELVPYLASVAEPDRLRIEGLRGGRWQKFRTVAGTVGVITAVVAGSAVGLAVAAVSSHSLPAAITAGALVGLGVLTALMRHQALAWRSATAATLFDKTTRDGPTDHQTALNPSTDSPSS